MTKTAQILCNAVLFTVIALWSSSGVCSMLDAEEMRRSLKGIAVCTVRVEVSDKIESVLFLDQIRTDVELKLRLVGLTVLSEKASMDPLQNTQWKSHGRPTIAVEVVAPTCSETESFIFCATLSLIQDASLSRAPGIPTPATTWSKVGVGAADFELIRKHIRNDLLDVFLNDYLSVNPK